VIFVCFFCFILRLKKLFFCIPRYAWFFWGVVLGWEIRTSHLWGRHYTTWATLSVLFILVMFEVGAHILRYLPQLWSSYFRLPRILVAGMTCACHHTQIFFEIGSCELSCTVIWISASCIVRTTDLSHCVWFELYIILQDPHPYTFCLKFK
jgi:hypothetical protein